MQISPKYLFLAIALQITIHINLKSRTFETTDWPWWPGLGTLTVRSTAILRRRTFRTHRTPAGVWCIWRFCPFARPLSACSRCARPSNCPGLSLSRRRTVSAGRSAFGRRGRFSSVLPRTETIFSFPRTWPCPTWKWSCRWVLSTPFWTSCERLSNWPWNSALTSA